MSSTFRLPCFRDLSLELGVSDAACELTEIAIRQLELEAAASGDVCQHIEGLSKIHRVKVTINEDSVLFRVARRSYIILVHAFFAQFLTKLRSELHSITLESWENKKNHEIPVEYVLAKLKCSKSSIEPFAGKYWFELSEYYRLCRNQIVHPKADYSKRLSTLRGQIEISRATCDDRYSKLSGPNPPDSLQFDDLILYSRLVKDIAKGMCIVARPADLQFQNLKLQEKFPGSKQNLKRLNNQIQGYLCSEYCFSKEEASSIVQTCLTG